jgi:hypothetical protein
MKWPLVLAAFLAISGCRSEAEPTVDQIEEGYQNVTEQNLKDAIAHFGSEENIPSIALGMIKMKTEVDSPVCEKNQNNLGYLCTFNITLINTGGKRLDPVNDIKARVWEGPNGWLIHEYEE